LRLDKKIFCSIWTQTFQRCLKKFIFFRNFSTSQKCAFVHHLFLYLFVECFERKSKSNLIILDPILSKMFPAISLDPNENRIFKRIAIQCKRPNQKLHANCRMCAMGFYSKKSFARIFCSATLYMEISFCLIQEAVSSFYSRAYCEILRTKTNQNLVHERQFCSLRISAEYITQPNTKLSLNISQCLWSKLNVLKNPIGNIITLEFEKKCQDIFGMT
jgi:hypothetical protein